MNNKLFKWTDILFRSVISIIVILMVSAVFFNALLRYFFNSGLMWSEELARYLFVWLIFLGSIMAYKDREHIVVDMLISAINFRYQKILYLISNIFIIVSMFIFTYGLILLINLNKGIKGPATGLPLNILYYGGLFCGLAIIILAIYQTVRFIQNKDFPVWMKSKVSLDNKPVEGDE